MKLGLTCGSAALMALLSTWASPSSAQLIPQPWGSVGVRNDETTFSVGVRALDLGVELGSGTENSVGVDVLTFFNIPLTQRRVSPYLGVGFYSEDQGIAVSGGVQANPADRLMLGVGYHSIRGINGQVGIRLF
jgi:opacity protein-like surface antigen